MAVTTVAQFAAELNRPATTLLEQLKAAGVAKASPEDALTEADKERLLDYLRSAHGTAGSERKKITLTRKSTTEIKQADASGKARTIQVEVRKKRVFVKRDEPLAVPAAEPARGPVVDQAELQRREEEARRQAELLRRQEEELAEKRRQREEQERREREEAEARAREEEARREAERAAAEAAARAAAQAVAPAPAAAEPAEVTASAASAEAAPAAVPSPVAAPTPAPAPASASAPAEGPKPGLRVVKAADIEAEEKQRLADLERRRRAAEAEAAAIRALPEAAGKLIVTPGVRPAGAALGDQKRVETPASALLAGADHLVVGRPIWKAEDPLAATQAILSEIRGI